VTATNPPAAADLHRRIGAALGQIDAEYGDEPGARLFAFTEASSLVFDVDLLFARNVTPKTWGTGGARDFERWVAALPPVAPPGMREVGAAVALAFAGQARLGPADLVTACGTITFGPSTAPAACSPVWAVVAVDHEGTAYELAHPPGDALGPVRIYPALPPMGRLPRLLASALRAVRDGTVSL
jgi:hypothetical protein